MRGDRTTVTWVSEIWLRSGNLKKSQKVHGNSDLEPQTVAINFLLCRLNSFSMKRWRKVCQAISTQYT